MKPVFIEFTDSQGKKAKTFTACSLKTGMMDNIFDIAERAEKLKSDHIDMTEVRGFFKDLKALIVSVYGGQFTYDELNEGVEQDEIMRVFQNLCENMMGEMQKN